MFSCGSCTQKGRKHENQDALLLASCLPRMPLKSMQNALPDHQQSSGASETLSTEYAPQSPPMMVAFVADGVSSCKEPKRASHLAVQTFWQRFSSAHFDDSAEASGLLEMQISKALEEVNNVLYFSEHYERQPALLTTFSGLVLEPTRAHVVNVGDSRVYRFYNHTLHYLTRDHSHQRGFYKGALASALGAHERLRIDYSQQPLIDGEVYLIATDGVYEAVSDDEITLFLEQAAMLRSGGAQSMSQALERIAQQLCDAAFQNGSGDNLSCVLVRVDASDAVRGVSSNFQQRAHKRFPPALAEGDTLDNFVIKKALHTSPRSQVYLAEDAHSQALRVIKTPSEYFNDDALYISRFFKEEKIGLSLQHASILSFYPKPLDSEYIYHVTEYVQGQTLREYIDRYAPVSLSVARELVSKIVVALRVLHRSHLLHQDLKPDNIMLTESGEVKIIDLGSVGSLVFRDAETSPPGALDYTAPEYYLDEPTGIFSDVFSLAVIAYELLTKRTPFAGQKIAQAKNELRFRPPHELKSDLPPWLTAVFGRAFSLKPRARYQTPSELLVDLDPRNHQSVAGEPLIVRNPLLFWKSLSVVLFALVCLLSYLLWG